MSRQPVQPRIGTLGRNASRMALGGRLISEARIRRFHRLLAASGTGIAPAPGEDAGLYPPPVVVPGVFTWGDFPAGYTWADLPAGLTWGELDSLDDLEAP